MKIKFLPIFFIIFFSITFVLFYKGLESSNIYEPNLKVEMKIPIFDAKNFENDGIISSKNIFSENKFYIVNIWASWCVPCRVEHPFLENLSKTEKVVMIGINYKDRKSNAINFLNELKNPYDIVLFDKDGTLAIEWGAYGVPETFVVNDGKILKKIVGPINEISISEIKNLIK